MKYSYSAMILISILITQWVCEARDFDFFYFVQQWPGSYCDTKKSCCYPTIGKPDSDFGIHGLWPNYKDGSYPSNCDPDSPFNPSEISDLSGRMRKSWPSLACPSSNGLGFWTHEWEKHGTCSESVLDQRAYFQAALDLKKQADLLKFLTDADIHPNDEFYSLESIKKAIEEGSGYSAWIECNKDESGNSQLYQVYMCVDSSGSEFIQCPIFPHGKCDSQIQFPSF